MFNKIEEFLKKLNIIFSEQLSDLQEIALVLGGLLVISILSLFFFSKEVTLNLMQNLIWLTYLLSTAFIYIKIISENKKRNINNKKYYIIILIGGVVAIILNILVNIVLRWFFGEKTYWHKWNKKQNARNCIKSNRYRHNFKRVR